MRAPIDELLRYVDDATVKRELERFAQYSNAETIEKLAGLKRNYVISQGLSAAAADAAEKVLREQYQTSFGYKPNVTKQKVGRVSGAEVQEPASGAPPRSPLEKRVAPTDLHMYI